MSARVHVRDATKNHDARGVLTKSESTANKIGNVAAASTLSYVRNQWHTFLTVSFTFVRVFFLSIFPFLSFFLFLSLSFSLFRSPPSARASQ
jgi:hypothetical protein